MWNGLDPTFHEKGIDNVIPRSVDTSVLAYLVNGMTELIPYMPRSWQHRLLGGTQLAPWAVQLFGSQYTVPKNILFTAPVTQLNDVAVGPTDFPGSDPCEVASTWLDPEGLWRAILIGGSALGLGSVANPDLAAVIATAHNQWLAERWLTSDQRFRGTAIVAPHQADAAVAEIGRIANDSRFVQVQLPLSRHLMGERQFLPIYEAAADADLPVCIFPSQVEGITQLGPWFPGGIPTYFAEWMTGAIQVLASNLVSLICHGVFEALPRLRITVAGGGFAWLPELMWRLDAHWKALRDETPWVHELPSQYVSGHVRVVADAIPELEDAPGAGLALVQMANGETTLMFGSGYPLAGSTAGHLPEHIRGPMCQDNPVAWFGERLQ